MEKVFLGMTVVWLLGMWVILNAFHKRERFTVDQLEWLIVGVLWTTFGVATLYSLLEATWK